MVVQMLFRGLLVALLIATLGPTLASAEQIIHVTSDPPAAWIVSDKDWRELQPAQREALADHPDETHLGVVGRADGKSAIRLHPGQNDVWFLYPHYQPQRNTLNDNSDGETFGLKPKNAFWGLWTQLLVHGTLAIAVMAILSLPMAALGLFIARKAGRAAARQARLEAEPTLLNETVNGYHITETLGEGAFARVYRATQVTTGDVVAMKVLKSEYLDQLTADVINRFNREAMVQLIHPNVVIVLDYGEIPPALRPYMVLEFIDGTSLRALLRPRLDPAHALPLFLQMCAGLQFAHLRGYVHRDLKPENIMVTHGGVAKIADFGIAKHLQKPAATRSATTMGTPRYMSPEHLDSKHTDTRADVYSMGIILFEMLTGQTPFDGDLMELIGHHMFTIPPRITDLDPALPEELAHIVGRMLEKQPGERYQTMDEVAQALEAAATQLNLTLR
ncbi:MAG TPA: serine/threonine-protein kinase [Candidatus Xenobia bacterium]|jgi:tRNA A-37 threonylcarbamoyl transferase component Bud32